MRRALDYYLTAMRAGSDRRFQDLLREEAGETALLPLRRAAWGAVRRRGPHTMPTAILMATEAHGRPHAPSG